MLFLYYLPHLLLQRKKDGVVTIEPGVSLPKAYLNWARSPWRVTGVLLVVWLIWIILVLCSPKKFWNLWKSGQYISCECQEMWNPCQKKRGKQTKRKNKNSNWNMSWWEKEWGKNNLTSFLPCPFKKYVWLPISESIIFSLRGVLDNLSDKLDQKKVWK